MIDDAVTVEHLLAHRSGIGDYLDEDAGWEIDDYVMPVPVHQLDTPEHFVPTLDGHAQSFPPDERFTYNNGGYVVLALIAERASGLPYAELVDRRVCAPAGLADTAFLRSDELPGRAAAGYLDHDGRRTNTLHMPVVGVGDGGLYSTLADMKRLWTALLDGRIVAPHVAAEMMRARSKAPEDSRRYGLGFWIHATRDVAMLEGYDPGISFQTACDPERRVTWTVVSNTSDGAWPMVRILTEHLTD